MYAGADKLAKFKGSQRFAKLAVETFAVVAGAATAKCFKGFYHELFNKLKPEPVFDMLKAWLSIRL